MKPDQKDKTNPNPEKNPSLPETVVEEPQLPPPPKKPLPPQKEKGQQPKPKNNALQNGMLLVGLVVLIGVTLWSILGRYQASSIATNPTPTPTVGYTPGVKGIIATINPTETPAPTPTPTPTFEPLTDEPIMGFVFGEPQEIPNTRQIYGLQIVDWLPDSSNEILIKGYNDLGILDISTGKVKLYATVENAGNIRQPVWLSEIQSIAYLSSDIETGHQNLWLGQGKNGSKLLLENVEPPLVPLGDKQGVVIYNNISQSRQGFNTKGEELKGVASFFNTLPHPKTGVAAGAYQTTLQPTGNWLAYYNSQEFRLFNVKTGEIQSVNLNGLWVMIAKWSPNGQKLALIITEGEPPVDFSDLYILDWPVATLHKVEHNFWAIRDVTWGPDSKHLLVQPITDTQNGFSVLALYITDISKPSDIIPVPIPTEGLVSGLRGGGLSWSPNGQSVLVKYADKQNAAIYEIKVSLE